MRAYLIRRLIQTLVVLFVVITLVFVLFRLLPGDPTAMMVDQSLDELADIRLEQIVRHPETASRIQHLLREEEAVGAVEVAHGARRLCEQVKRRRRVGNRRNLELQARRHSRSG